MYIRLYEIQFFSQIIRAFFGHFSAKSTQLELAVFEFFLDLGLRFFQILLELLVFTSRVAAWSGKGLNGGGGGEDN